VDLPIYTTKLVKDKLHPDTDSIGDGVYGEARNNRVILSIKNIDVSAFNQKMLDIFPGTNLCVGVSVARRQGDDYIEDIKARSDVTVAS
jgi:hypothetical protein